MPTHDAWLAPMSAHEFVRDVWGRRTRAFRPIDSALQRDPAWSELASLDALHAVDAATIENGRHVMTRIARSSIDDALTAGATVCGDITRHSSVRAWLDHAQRELGLGRGGFAKLYVSPPGRGFPLHFDPHHVFVLQCRGQKRWWCSAEPAVPNASEPARVASGRPVFSGRYDGIEVVNDAGTIDAPSDLIEVTLQPGDALYLPPGAWHRAEAIDTSIAVSLSPPRLHAFDLVMRHLEGRALQQSAWLQDLAALGEDPEAVAAHVMRVTHQVSDALKDSVDALLKQRAMRIAEGQPVHEDALSRIERTTKLERTSAIPQRRTADQLLFYGGGQEWALPLEARPFVEKLVETSPFEAGEALRWDPALSWEDARALLEQLRAAGVLREVP